MVHSKYSTGQITFLARESGSSLSSLGFLTVECNFLFSLQECSTSHGKSRVAGLTMFGVDVLLPDINPDMMWMSGNKTRNARAYCPFSHLFILSSQNPCLVPVITAKNDNAVTWDGDVQVCERLD